ncbi:Hypothetical protein A7982_01008 [Minicystis rosea]|nr:Hypothetical protein A7982_01008 [Minicystis rosea]
MLFCMAFRREAGDDIVRPGRDRFVAMEARVRASRARVLA